MIEAQPKSPAPAPQGQAVQQRQPARTTYAVWEITLKCNLACSHCGSRAGDTRHDELTTAEALDLVHQMADAGINEVTLIGGEAFLRKDWLRIAEEIIACGMLCTMTTGGYGLSRRLAERMREVGFTQVSVSVDGLEDVHDELRGRKGSFNQCFETMRNLRDAGLIFACNSQLNRHSAKQLPMLYKLLVQAGARAWQLAMTVPMGHAADNNHILLQPPELLVLHPMLAYLAKRGHQEGLIIQPGNNTGYYGPYERLMRGHGQDSEWRFFTGCQAGTGILGIEADGVIKGCPSLPTKAYAGGNIRDLKLTDIIETRPELNFNMNQGTASGTDHLWGFCQTCDYAELCRGGCSWTSHVFFDRRGNNPYCYHRALEQDKQGMRERFFLDKPASGLPFDNGVFALIEEPADTNWPDDDPLRFKAEDVIWPDEWNIDPETWQEYPLQQPMNGSPGHD